MSDIKVEPSIPQNQCNLLMQDSRMFTDYRPRDVQNQPLGTTKDSHGYRQFLIANAGRIMNDNLARIAPALCQEEYEITPPTQPLYPRTFV